MPFTKGRDGEKIYMVDFLMDSYTIQCRHVLLMVNKYRASSKPHVLVIPVCEEGCKIKILRVESLLE